jgi:glycine cleavage system H protein
MNIPSNLQYTKDHEWAKIENGVATIGITDFAQGELGDIVFVELPEAGKSFNAGDAFGTIEAVKTVTDLFSPISGKIVAINEGLDSDPGKVNSDPYGDGWLVKIRLSDPDEKDGLMSSIAYEEIIGY